MSKNIKCVIFDFGGVIAEEGWTNGLHYIADQHGFDREEFFHKLNEIIFETGFVTGQCRAEDYWPVVKERVELKYSGEEMTKIVLDRFIPRDYIIKLIDDIKNAGYRLAILSDQTHWLDELNEKYGFMEPFEIVYNSFHKNKTKRDATFVVDLCDELGIKPEEAVFIDDNKGHIERALSKGVNAVLYDDYDRVMGELKTLINI